MKSSFRLPFTTPRPFPKGTSVLVCTPMYGSQCFASYVESLLDLKGELDRAGVEMRTAFVRGSSLVHVARNALAGIFLRTSATHLLFADADVGFRGADVVRMLRADLDLIAGLYPMKVINWPAVQMAAKDGASDLEAHAACYVVQFLPGGVPKIDPDKPLEVFSAGTGLMLIKRRVFETLAPHVEVYRKTDRDENGHLTTGEGGERAYFTTPILNGGLYGEDTNFCRLWREHGGKVYAAPWAKCSHTGTHTFEGADRLPGCL